MLSSSHHGVCFVKYNSHDKFVSDLIITRIQRASFFFKDITDQFQCFEKVTKKGRRIFAQVIKRKCHLNVNKIDASCTGRARQRTRS